MRCLKRFPFPLASTARIRGGAAALAAALLLVGCGSSSSDRSTGAAPERAAQRASLESSASSTDRGASDGRGRQSGTEAKPKAAKHAAGAQKKNLAEAAKQGIARRIVRELTSRRPGHHAGGLAPRVRKALRHILGRGDAQGGSGSQPSTTADAVQQILNQAAK